MSSEAASEKQSLLPKKPSVQDAEESQETDTPSLDSRWFVYRVLKTAALTAGGFGIGFYTAILAPTLIDLKELLRVDYEEISRCVMGRSIGLLCGSFVGGYLGQRHQKRLDWWLALGYILIAGSVASIPWTPPKYLELLAVFYFILGLSQAAMSTISNPLCISMWQTKASTAVFGYHLAYSVGQLVAPLVASPFILNKNSTNEFINSTAQSVWSEFRSHDFLATGDNSTFRTKIQIPYAICGSYNAACSFIFVCFALYKHPATMTELQGTKKSIKVTISEETSRGTLKLFIVLLIFVPFLSFTTIARDTPFTYLLVAIGVDDIRLKFDEHTAVLMFTTYNLVSAGSRIVSILLLKILPIQTYFFFTVYSAAGFLAYVTFFMPHHAQTTFWVVMCCYAATARNGYTAAFVWLDRYIEVTAPVAAINDIGYSTGDLVFVWFSGYLMTNKGPSYVILSCFACSCAVCLVLTVMQCLASFKGTRARRS